MDNKLIGKVFAAVAMGLLFGAYIQNDYARWGERGREAFLAHESQRFDHYMATPHPATLSVFGALIVAFGALAIYEILALAFSAAIKAIARTDTQ